MPVIPLVTLLAGLLVGAGVAGLVGAGVGLFLGFVVGVLFVVWVEG